MADKIKLLTKEQLEKIQSEDLNVAVISITEEQLAESKNIVQELKEFEAEFPEFKKDDEYYDHLAYKSELKRIQQDERDRLERTPLRILIQDYLENLKPETKRNYAYYFRDMIRRNLLPEKDANGNDFSLGHFNHVNHEKQIDYIKMIPEWSEGTKQLKAACYISFTKYLERLSRGWFRPALPNLSGVNPTFYQIREKVVSKALNLQEWNKFISALHNINNRDSIIARCMFQGAKRISEVLTLQLDQIDWLNNIIRFKQKKTGGTDKEIPIHYPKHFMDELKEYIENTNFIRKDSKFVFITRNGKPVVRSRCNDSFKLASQTANIQRVNPHMLRATYITLVKQQGFQDSDIQKISGHQSSKMINAYDKTSAEANISKKLQLI